MAKKKRIRAALRRLSLETNLLKEGASIGLIVGLLVYAFKSNLGFIINQINSWFGPFSDTQLLWVLLYLGVTIGIIIDYAFVSPREHNARLRLKRRG
jgi:hypothetical protein